MKINTAEYLISSAKVEQCPKAGYPEYAFIGRSNVGKSSLINMLADNAKLAKTSSMPGKTVLINHFLISPTRSNQTWHLVDLPGYGFAQTGQKQREKLKTMIERYCLLREALVSLFVLIDCRLEAQKIDLEFIDWLGNNQIPFAIVFTKADKLGKVRLEENVEAYKNKLLETWEELPPIFVTSAEKGVGETEILDYIEQINQTLV